MLYQTPSYAKTELQLPRTLSSVYKHDDRFDFPEDHNHITSELFLKFIANAKVRYRLCYDKLEADLIAAGYTLVPYKRNNWAADARKLDDRYNYYLVRVK